MSIITQDRSCNILMKITGNCYWTTIIIISVNHPKSSTHWSSTAASAQRCPACSAPHQASGLSSLGRRCPVPKFDQVSLHVIVLNMECVTVQSTYLLNGILKLKSMDLKLEYLWSNTWSLSPWAFPSPTSVHRPCCWDPQLTPPRLWRFRDLCVPEATSHQLLCSVLLSTPRPVLTSHPSSLKGQS